MPAKMTLSAQSLSFARNEGAAEAVNALEVVNAGGGAFTYHITAATAGMRQWLKVTPANGTLQAGQIAAVHVIADPAGLKPGTYPGSLVVTAETIRTVVAVTLSVHPASPAILLSRSALSFTAVVGGRSPSPQKVNILSIGAGPLHWRAAVAKGGLVRLETASGVANVFGLDVDELTVSVAAARYSPGQYYDRILITGEADSSPHVITILMNVLPEGSTPGPEVTPSGLVFVAKAGENPGPQTVTYNNLGRDAVTYQSIGRGTGSSQGRTWFDTAPSSGCVMPNAPASIVIQPALRNFNPGVYRGVVTFLEKESGIFRSVSLLAVVLPSDLSAS